MDEACAKGAGPSEASEQLVASITLLLELSETSVGEDLSVLIYMVGSLCKRYERAEGTGAEWLRKEVEPLALRAYLAFQGTSAKPETRQ